MSVLKEISQVNKKRLDLVAAVPLSVPLVIYIEPSGLCNLRCGFCMHRDRNNVFPKNLMALGLFKKIVDDIGEFEEGIKLLRVCGNGEPLTNKNILEMLEYARSSKRIEKIELVSNGILLKDYHIENICNSIDRIVISIEGLSDEEYLKVTGKKVSFSRLVEKIRQLYGRRGDCKIHIKIHSSSVKTEKERGEFFKTFGDICDEIFIENLVPMWPDLDIGLNKEKGRYGGAVIDKVVCPQIFKGFQIQAEGEVVACCVDWQRKNHIGDINNSSVVDVWNGTFLRQLQYEHLSGNKRKIEICSKCTMNDTNEIDFLDDGMNEIKNKYEANYSLTSKL